MKKRNAFLSCIILAFSVTTASAATGGPDGFGYTYHDSDEADGPRYVWQDISATGTPLSLGDDEYFYPINLPFSFDFYGSAYTDVAVGSNGTVYFEDTYLGLGNTSIPGTNSYGVSRFIAGYWDDLNPGSGGEIYYEVSGSAPDRRLIVQWENVPRFGSSDSVTFQVVLAEGSNDILVNYEDPSSAAGSGATEGIQGDDSTGLEYGYNTANLTDSLAICYTHPGSADPSCGTREIHQVPAASIWGLLSLGILIAFAAWKSARRPSRWPQA